MNLEKPTFNHTMYHVEGMEKAYICGGWTTDIVDLNDVLEFDISDQKLKTFGQLITARCSAGVVICHKYLWVFNG